MTLRRLPDGQWVKEPELPPWTLCGGMQDVYLPALSNEELEQIANDPESSPAAAQRAAEELTARRGKQRD